MNRHEVEASVDKITQKDGWMSQYNIGITDLRTLIGNYGILAILLPLILYDINFG